MERVWEKLFIDQIDLNGIHRDILKRQSEGLSGHIGEHFKDLSADSAWLGGQGEAWERGPYYIDGLIPLAYLMNDKNLIDMSSKWVEAIMSSQRESGFFGPEKNNDWWPRAVVLKALVSYYLATKNNEVIVFMEKYFDYLLKHIDEHPCDFWGYARGMEGYEALTLIEDKVDKAKLRLIETKLKENTLDWKSFFADFPYQKPTEFYMNKHLFRVVKYLTNVIASLSKKRKRPPKINRKKILAGRESKNNLIFLKTHGVNLAMALKYPLYWGESSKEMFAWLDHLLQYHGNAIQIFSSDEHLNGTSPNAGVELCTVVEMMYTMEEAMRLTGSMQACDRLEYHAYNALMATITNDFRAHQYVQQINQLDCQVKPHRFYDANRYANTFGIEPNYGCCAANMHQGWPKMMLSAIMKTETLLGVFLYVSGTYTVNFPSGYVRFAIKTEYPFSDQVMLHCLESTVDESVRWLLRIPYKSNVTYTRNQQSQKLSNRESLEIEALVSGEEISLNFDFDILTISNPDGSISVRRGPLLFSQAIAHEEFLIKGIPLFHDRGYRPLADHEVALVTKNGSVVVKEMIKKTDSQSFWAIQVILRLEAYDEAKKGYFDLDLTQYGNTVLRRTHFKSFNKNNIDQGDGS
ncbi:MAG: glycoside hydrolase family 127 protein [Bacilli bacterium]|nr:glycoside hydrolase family 127 protein [Bacilli bacterium]